VQIIRRRRTHVGQVLPNDLFNKLIQTNAIAEKVASQNRSNRNKAIAEFFTFDTRMLKR